MPQLWDRTNCIVWNDVWAFAGTQTAFGYQARLARSARLTAQRRKRCFRCSPNAKVCTAFWSQDALLHWGKDGEWRETKLALSSSTERPLFNSQPLFHLLLFSGLRDLLSHMPVCGWSGCGVLVVVFCCLVLGFVGGFFVFTTWLATLFTSTRWPVQSLSSIACRWVHSLHWALEERVHNIVSWQSPLKSRFGQCTFNFEGKKWRSQRQRGPDPACKISLFAPMQARKVRPWWNICGAVNYCKKNSGWAVANAVLSCFRHRQLHLVQCPVYTGRCARHARKCIPCSHEYFTWGGIGNIDRRAGFSCKIRQRSNVKLLLNGVNGRPLRSRKP